MSASILFCQCGSSTVDVRGWISPTVPEIACSSCGKTASIPGFTIGRSFSAAGIIAVKQAVEDRACCRADAFEPTLDGAP
mgnify:CR=1 FL=1